MSATTSSWPDSRPACPASLLLKLSEPWSGRALPSPGRAEATGSTRTRQAAALPSDPEPDDGVPIPNSQRAMPEPDSGGDGERRVDLPDPPDGRLCQAYGDHRGNGVALGTWTAPNHGLSAPQAGIKGEALRPPEPDVLEGRVQGIEEIVQLSRDNCRRHGEHCRPPSARPPRPEIGQYLRGRVVPPVPGEL